MKTRPALPALPFTDPGGLNEAPPSSPSLIAEAPRHRLDAPPPSMTLAEWEASLPHQPLPRVSRATISHLYKGDLGGPNPRIIDNRKPKRTLWSQMVRETNAKRAADALRADPVEGS